MSKFASKWQLLNLQRVISILVLEMRVVRKDAAALIPGPVLLRRGLPRFWGARMDINFVYLDEFGHIGPYMGRNGARFNESPVFGLAGIILPGNAIRPFATKFLQLKQHIF